jgi:hypothetical protein
MNERDLDFLVAPLYAEAASLRVSVANLHRPFSYTKRPRVLVNRGKSSIFLQPLVLCHLHLHLASPPRTKQHRSDQRVVSYDSTTGDHSVPVPRRNLVYLRSQLCVATACISDLSEVDSRCTLVNCMIVSICDYNSMLPSLSFPTTGASARGYPVRS